jgi:hypothetical protein
MERSSVVATGYDRGNFGAALSHAFTGCLFFRIKVFIPFFFIYSISSKISGNQDLYALIVQLTH